MTKPTGFELFCEQWNQEFKHQEIQFAKGRIDDHFWGGSAAYKSLKSADALWLITTAGGELAELYLSWLYREVRLYRSYQNVVETNKSFSDVIDALDGAKKRLETAEGQVFLPELKVKLLKAAEYLNKEINTVRDRRKAYWAEALLEADRETDVAN